MYLLEDSSLHHYIYKGKLNSILSMAERTGPDQTIVPVEISFGPVRVFLVCPKKYLWSGIYLGADS